MLTRDLLSALCPRPRSGLARQTAWDGYVDALLSDDATDLFARFLVVTPLRMAHFLANAAHETGGFTIIWESGAYSAERIMQIFGVGNHSARITPAEARHLAHNGPALFERVYGLGNPKKARELGNTQPGDGWRYRGCGIMQITGRGDHERYADMIGCKTDEIERPINAVHAALLEWRSKGCNVHADADDYVKVRRLINGGRNGLADVRQYLARAKKLLADSKPLVDKPAVNDLIRLGSGGPLVTWLQGRLAAHGYHAGAIDGAFGKYTEAQLVAWQHQHGFPATGVYDPDNQEQRAALDAPPKAAPQRDVTADDLSQRGSETVGVTRWWKQVLGWVFGVNTAAAADQTFGIGAVDAVVAQGEKVKSLAERTSGLLQYVPDMKILAFIGVGVAVVLAYRAFDTIEKRRVADAMSGAHLGR